MRNSQEVLKSEPTQNYHWFDGTESALSSEARVQGYTCLGRWTLTCLSKKLYHTINYEGMSRYHVYNQLIYASCYTMLLFTWPPLHIIYLASDCMQMAQFWQGRRAFHTKKMYTCNPLQDYPQGNSYTYLRADSVMT